MQQKRNFMIAEMDLGYGFVKAVLDGEEVKQPSVFSPLTSRRPDPINQSNQEQVKNTIEDLFNQMNVEIDQNVFLLGNASANSSLPSETYRLNSQMGKANQDITFWLALSLIAVKKVKEEYAKRKNIFDPMSVNVALTTALPIREIYRNDEDQRKAYKEKFLEKKHIVIFHNFISPISVTIKFKDVQVFKEGEVGTLYGINFGTTKIKAGIKKYLEENYPSHKPYQNIFKAQNIIGIDIGQNTTDISVIHNGKGDGFSSQSIPQGFANILEQTIDKLSRMKNGYQLNNISQLQRILKSDQSVVQEKKNLAQSVIDEFTPSLTRNIVNVLDGVLQSIDDIEVIYIFGGGAIPMKNSDLQKQIIDTLKYDNQEGAMVIWIDKEFAQTLNEIGLKVLGDARARQLSKEK